MSLDVAAGQLAVIAGPAGSGRTSLLLALAGRMRLVTGTVAVGGYRIPGDERRVRQLVGVAAAPPAMDLDEYLRVDDHIAERALTEHARTTPAAVAEAFDVLGIDPPRRLPVGELRPDDRSLLAAALAAAASPAAVVVDDADRGCAPEERRRVWAGLLALAERGCTVLASSTEIPPAIDQADIAVTLLPHPLDPAGVPVPEGEGNR